MIAVFFVILVASLIQFKKTVLFTAAVLMFMNNLSTGIDGLKLFYGVVMAQIIFFYVLGYYKKRKSSYPRYILIPTLLAGSCYFISSYLGSIHAYAKNIVNISAWFYFPYIFWHVMSSKKEVIIYGRFLLIFFMIVSLYAILELLLGQNIYSMWADQTGIIQGDLGGVESEERFGLLRCNSILPYSSALGMNSSIVFLVLFILSTKGCQFPICWKLLIFLLPLCVLLCGTRSQYIVFALCFLALLMDKNIRKTSYMKILIVVVCVGVIVFSPIFIEIIDSIIHSDTSSTGGSNMNMRLRQFAVTEYYWNQSPWFGHGRNYTWEVAIPLNPSLMGAESIVFSQLIDHGSIGLFSFYLIGICLTIWSYRYSKPLAMLPIVFIIGKTISTVVGVEYNIPIILCIFAVKALTLNKNVEYEIQR